LHRHRDLSLYRCDSDGSRVGGGEILQLFYKLCGGVDFTICLQVRDDTAAWNSYDPNMQTREDFAVWGSTGEEDSFGEFYRRYRVRVAAWCRRMMKDPDRAEDMTQEVFLRAFRYRESFRGDSRVSTWLYSIARNYCLTALRKAGDDPAAGATALDPRLHGSSGFETLRRMERDEEFRAVWRLLHTALTPLEARVMVLHYGRELPLAEITRRLSLSNPSGAKGYVVNARRKMGAALGRGPRRRRLSLS
jgi:RNA polymerase sigma-70 factor (ECF subfamily)